MNSAGKGFGLKHFVLTIFLCCSVFLGCGKNIETGPGRYMDIDDVKVGMKGFGRTVFRGDTVDTFEVEVVGIMTNWDPGADMILAELHHPVTDEAKGIAGMSGSPVYIDGKMVGAVAYGWSFQTRTLMGITPIKQMMVKDLKKSDTKKAEAHRSNPAFAKAPDNGYDMRPLALPLTVSSATGEFRELLRTEFRKKFGRDILITAGGKAGGTTRHQIGDLEEGSAVAVKLIEGDLDIAAVGTVTCIDGDTVYAFGHPFNSDGMIQLPMAKAWIHTTMSSQYSSFKLSSTGDTVGTFIMDYAHGIKGIIGEKPRMVDITTEVHNLDLDTKENYSFKVVHDKSWTPFMTTLTVYYAISGSTIIGNEMSAWLESEINIEGAPPVTGRDFFFSYGSPGFNAAFPFWFKLEYLMDNRIASLKINSINMSLKVKSGRHIRFIEKYYVDDTSVKPGDDVEVTVFLKEYQKEPVPVKITVTVPRDIPEGTVLVKIYNGLLATIEDLRRAPGKDRPETVAQLAEIMSEKYDANMLLADFNVFEPGLTVEGVEFEDLPESVVSVYKDLPTVKVESTNYKLFKRVEIPRDEVITGAVSLTLDVSRHN